MPDGPATHDDDAAPTSAADSLRLIREQRAATERSLSPDPRLTYWPWGIAWLVGFGLLYLRHGPQERPLWNIPGYLPLTVLFTLMIAALVISSAAGIRSGRAVRGESSTKGFMYGFSWFLGFAGFMTIAGHFSDFLPAPERGLLWAATSVGVVSVLYLAGGAVWGAPELFVLGCWIGVLNIAGVVAGPGWHSLVIAVAGGGGLVLGGFLAWRRMGRGS
jgi:hypothetical protein